MIRGKIVKQISNDYTVKSDGKLYVCKARGKFRNQGITPLVGDEVKLQDNCIMEVLPRFNELNRPSICNIDEGIIITSLKNPDFSSNLLDKLIVVTEFNGIKPIIIFTKSDLLNDFEFADLSVYINYYKSIGYDVYFNDDIDNIKKIFKDKVCVFIGQTGAGKSTLLNKIDPSLNLKTDEISMALGRGKHTTRHTELLEICGGMVADTPGFSALDFTDMSSSDIRDNFIEFNLYRDKCRFRDCMHVSEVGCEIIKKVEDGSIIKSRYDNYLKFIGR